MDRITTSQCMALKSVNVKSTGGRRLLILQIILIPLKWWVLRVLINFNLFCSKIFTEYSCVVNLQCIQPSWYLSADFQLVLFSPLIMYPAYKWGWKFLWLLPVYVIAIQVWIFVAAMMHGYKPSRLLMYGHSLL